MSSFMAAYALVQSFFGAALVGATLLIVSLVIEMIRGGEDNRWINATLFVVAILWMIVPMAWYFIFPPDMATQLMRGPVYEPNPATVLIAKFFGLASGAGVVQVIKLWLASSRY